MKQAGAGDAERQPHHAAARRRRRRRRRDAHRLPRGPATRRSAWRWSATTSTSPTPTRSCASRTPPARRRIDARRHEGRRPAGRADQPPLDQERHRQPRRHASSTRPSARTATSARTAWRPRKAARRSGRSTARAARSRVFATGLRNPNGMAWEPATGALWTVVNERDELGSDLVPDYLTSVQRRRASTAGRTATTASTSTSASQPPRPDLVAKAIAPDYALGPHTASLGLASSAGAALAGAVRERHVRRPARLVEPQAAAAATR